MYVEMCDDKCLSEKGLYVYVCEDEGLYVYV